MKQECHGGVVEHAPVNREAGFPIQSHRQIQPAPEAHLGRRVQVDADIDVVEFAGREKRAVELGELQIRLGLQHRDKRARYTLAFSGRGPILVPHDLLLTNAGSARERPSGRTTRLPHARDARPGLALDAATYRGYQSPSRTSIGSRSRASRSAWIVAAIAPALSGRGWSRLPNQRAVALS